MASQVLIAHTGQRLHLDASQASSCVTLPYCYAVPVRDADSLSSLDNLKATVALNLSIPAQYIIALTPQGRPLKPQATHTEVS